jgi:hypothetical protein
MSLELMRVAFFLFQKMADAFPYHPLVEIAAAREAWRVRFAPVVGADLRDASYRTDFDEFFNGFFLGELLAQETRRVASLLRVRLSIAPLVLTNN